MRELIEAANRAGRQGQRHRPGGGGRAVHRAGRWSVPATAPQPVAAARALLFVAGLRCWPRPSPGSRGRMWQPAAGGDCAARHRRVTTTIAAAMAEARAGDTVEVPAASIASRCASRTA